MAGSVGIVAGSAGIVAGSVGIVAGVQALSLWDRVCEGNTVRSESRKSRHPWHARPTPSLAWDAFLFWPCSRRVELIYCCHMLPALTSQQNCLHHQTATKAKTMGAYACSKASQAMEKRRERFWTTQRIGLFAAHLREEMRTNNRRERFWTTQRVGPFRAHLRDEVRNRPCWARQWWRLLRLCGRRMLPEPAYYRQLPEPCTLLPDFDTAVTSIKKPQCVSYFRSFCSSSSSCSGVTAG